MRRLAIPPTGRLAGPSMRQAVLLLLLSAALVGFFLLLEFVVSVASTGPQDILAVTPYQENTFGVPNGAGLIELLIIPVSLVLAAAALVAFLGWPPRRASLRPSWSLALGVLIAASLVAAGAYLAFSGALGASVAYDEHMVQRAGLAPASLVLLAAFFLSVTVAGLINWRLLAASLAVWAAVAGVLGFSSDESLDGLLLLPRIQLQETPTAFEVLVTSMRQTGGASAEDLGALTTADASLLPDRSLLSEVTALQDVTPRDTPVFRVTGAAHTRHLRTSTGEGYNDGAWGQPDRATVKLEKGAFVPDTLGTLAERLHVPTETPLHEFVDRIAITPVEGADTLEAGVLPTPRNPQSIDTPATYFPFSETLSTNDRLPRFEVESLLLVFSLSQKIDAAPVVDETYLQLPDALPPRIRDLATHVTGDAPPYLKALLLKVHLQEGYVFGTANAEEETRPRPGQDPVDRFLFDHPIGSSSNFSSAFVVLARAAGVPARVVSGWVIATHEETQTVRRSQAHQWAEVALESLGWVTIDPFPQDTFSETDVDHAWETALEQLTASASPDVREAAHVLWLDSDNPEAVLQLFKSIDNTPDRDARRAARITLSALGLHRFIDMLLDHEDPLMRDAAAYGLRSLADSGALEALMEAMATDEDARVRATVAEALGLLGKDRAEETLLHALGRDENSAVRAAAARALGALQTQWTADAMLIALSSDSSPEVRAEVARALGEIGDSAALLPLLDARSDDTSADVRAAAAEALGDWSVIALIELLESAEDSALRVAAALLLGEEGRSEAIFPLSTALSDSEKQVREAARGALEEIGKVVWLESGGGVLVYQGNVAFLPQVTAESEGVSPRAPVFRVQGSSLTTLLRVGVGDIYQDGEWLPDTQDSLTAGVEGIGFRPYDIRPLQPGDAGRLNEIYLSAIGSDHFILSGHLPTSLHADSFSIPVTYRVQSHTVTAQGPPARYGWYAIAYEHSPELLDAAELWPDVELLPYTQLPNSAWIDRARAVATEITAGHKTPYAKAKAIEQYLIENYTYVLSYVSPSGVPQGQDPIADFLFDSREGTSGGFSSAFVILARTIGIPARVVSGWAVAGTRASQIVYTDQAHQWAEVPFEGLGWVTFDPTPEGAPSRVPPIESSDGSVDDDLIQHPTSGAEDSLASYEEQGAEVTRFENSGGLVELGREAFIHSGITTRQAAVSPRVALFDVVGATHTGYLRIAAGDRYENGSWTQLDPVDVAYAAGGDLSADMWERYDTLAGGFGAVPSYRLVSKSLFGFRDNPSIVVSNRIRLLPAEGSHRLPYGAMPTSLDLKRTDLNGVYHPFSATFSSETAAASYSWTSTVSAFSRERYITASGVADATYTQLPSGLPGRIQRLARQVTAGHDSPYAKAEALEHYLKTQYAYGFADSLSSGAPPAGRDPVDWFLFGSRRGTSGQFSSAFVILARSVGIPARVVGGFAISPMTERQTVYANQSHQWAEVALEGVGWTRFDPTPPGGAPSRVPGDSPQARIVLESSESGGQDGSSSSDTGGQDAHDPADTVTNITNSPTETRRQTPFVVEGTVLTTDGLDVSGMTVEIYINETKEHGGTKIGTATSLYGRFQAEAVLPFDLDLGDYQLLARAVGNNQFNESWSDPDVTVFSGNRIEMTGPAEVDRNAAAVFAGRVIEDAGRGVAQLELTVTLDGNRRPSVLTDEGGLFTFFETFSEPGQHWVEVELQGDELLLDNTARLNFKVVVPTEIAVYAPDSVVPGEEFLVTGELREPGGPPLNGGRVELIIERAGEERLITVEVGENGRFEHRFSSFENTGLYTLAGRFTGGEFVRPASAKVALRVLQPTVLALDGPAVVQEGEVFRFGGTLREIDGTPVPNARVQVLGEEPLSLMTDSQGRFVSELQATFDENAAQNPHESALRIEAAFDETEELASSSAALDIAVGLPRVLVETLGPVTRGSEAILRGTVLLGTHSMPGIQLTAGPGVTFRSDDLGAFMHAYPVPGDEPLGVTNLSISAPAFDVRVTFPLVVKSAANFTVTPVGKVRPGGTALLQAALVDDAGAGIPGAALRSSQGVHATTNELGMATLELAVPGAEDLQGSFVEFTYAGDDLHAPLSMPYFWEGAITPDGFNWLLWLGAPSLIAVAVAAAYAGRRFKAMPLKAPVRWKRAPAQQAPAPPEVNDGEAAYESEDSENDAGLDLPVRLQIGFEKAAEDLADVWGVGEEVRITVSAIGEEGQALAGAVVEVSVGDDAPSRLTAGDDGTCAFRWTGAEPGEYAVSAELVSDDELAYPNSRSLRIVDFRDEIVRLYGVFLDWAREKDAGIAESSTPREVRDILVSREIPIPQEALNNLVSRFEEADYSEHSIMRRHYEAMYRAWKAAAGAEQ